MIINVQVAHKICTEITHYLFVPHNHLTLGSMECSLIKVQKFCQSIRLPCHCSQL